MTIEEVERKLPERYKKNASVIADIITRLQEENISYTKAIFLLEKCKEIVGTTATL